MITESSLNWPNTVPPALVHMPRRRWPLVLVVIVVLSLAGAGGSYAWLNSGLCIPAARRTPTKVDTVSSDKAVLTDLLAAQQKTTDDLAAIDRAIADQQEQLKAIVSQLASVSAKIDTMTSPASQTQAAPFLTPAPAVVAPTVPTAHATPVPTAHVAPKQKTPPPRATNPTGPISVGGATLNVAPDATTQ